MAILIRLAVVELFCLYSLIFCVKSEDDHGSMAVSYDKESFDFNIALNRHFVMFYAPWCGHCKNLAPTWNELAKIYNSMEESPVVIAKVDCTVETALCSEHDVKGFPTLKLFLSRGKLRKRYSGKRDLEFLKSFLQDQLQEDGEPTVGEGQVPEVPKPLSPMVTLNDETFEGHIAAGSHFVKFFAPWCGHCKALAPTWLDLADTFSQSSQVSISELDCTRSSALCKKYEVRGYPTLVWFQDGKKVDSYSGARSHEALKQYVSQQMAKYSGATQHDSAEAGVREEREEDGVVKDLTEDTFKPFLAQNLVFVKFFAPWCGHCKRLAPVWEDLAASLRSERVTVAKVDCTQHKLVCNEHGVRGYPTLKLFFRGELLEDYRGTRTLEDLSLFVKKHLGVHDEL